MYMFIEWGSCVRGALSAKCSPLTEYLTVESMSAKIKVREDFQIPQFQFSLLNTPLCQSSGKRKKIHRISDPVWKGWHGRAGDLLVYAYRRAEIFPWRAQFIILIIEKITNAHICLSQILTGWPLIFFSNRSTNKYIYKYIFKIAVHLYKHIPVHSSIPPPFYSTRPPFQCPTPF